MEIIHLVGKGDGRNPFLSELTVRRYAAEAAITQMLGEKITGSQFSGLMKMIKSPDEENLILAEAIIEQKTNSHGTFIV